MMIHPAKPEKKDLLGLALRFLCFFIQVDLKGLWRVQPTEPYQFLVIILPISWVIIIVIASVIRHGNLAKIEPEMKRG